MGRVAVCHTDKRLLHGPPRQRPSRRLRLQMLAAEMHIHHSRGEAAETGSPAGLCGRRKQNPGPKRAPGGCAPAFPSHGWLTPRGEALGHHVSRCTISAVFDGKASSLEIITENYMQQAESV